MFRPKAGDLQHSVRLRGDNLKLNCMGLISHKSRTTNTCNLYTLRIIKLKILN
ncbi:hypothetical protein Hanom_Chr03g00192751 [Helianthus anomalus]